MNLLCLSDFNQGGIVAKAGDVLTIAPGAAQWLLESWPACWVRMEMPGSAIQIGKVNVAADMEQVAKALEAPPVNKMVSEPAKAKGKRKG